MPTPREFMERVVPWPEEGAGFINLHWPAPQGYHGWRGQPFKRVEEFMEAAQRLAMRPSVAKDLFFCTTVQSQTGKLIRNQFLTAKRSAQNATLVKALWLDIDVKPPPKGYPNIPTALTAIEQFVKDASMPAPSAIVFSGGGIHLYWISNKPLTIPEWKPYAEGLKAEAQRLGLRADYGCTADAARVLRVPGTFNRKLPDNPRPVVVKALGQDYDFEKDLPHLKMIGEKVSGPVITATVAATPFDLSGFTGGPAPAFAHLNPQADNLADGLNQHSDMPLDPTEIIKGCPHYREAFVTGGKGHGQGLWMLTVLGTTWFENGREFARSCSNGYPTYDEGETDAMFDRKTKERAERNLGWPTCNAFKSEGCKQCATCPYFGKLKSPLNLGERMKLPPAPLPFPTAASQALSLPAPYYLNDDGIISVNVEKTFKNGTSQDEPVPIFMCVLSDPWADDAGLHFKAHVGKGTIKEVTVPDEALANDQLLITHLSKGTHRVKCTQRGEKLVRQFMKDWVQQIDDEIKRRQQSPYGWLMSEDEGERTGFSYGGKLFCTSGAVQNSTHANPELQKNYQPTGKPGAVLDMIGIICALNRPPLEAILATSCGAPMAWACGEYTAIMWALSRESGAFKSTTIRTGSGVWGRAKLNVENASASTVGLRNKMAQIRNLPVYMDEIRTTKQLEDIEAHLNIITEGHEGSKSNRDGSLRTPRMWHTQLTVGANLSMRDMMLIKNRGTDAALQRVFEYEVPRLPGNRPSAAIDALVDSMEYNYGHIGMEIARVMGQDWRRWHDRATALREQFEADVDIQDGERFWRATSVVCLLGAEIGNEILQKTYFHIPELREFLIKTFLDQRQFVKINVTLANSENYSFSMLNDFFKFVSRNHLVTTAQSSGGRGRPIVEFVVGPKEGEPVHVHWIRNQRIVHVSKSKFQWYMNLPQVNAQPAYVFTQLGKHFGARTRERVNMTAGCRQYAQLPEAVLEIPIPEGSPFEEALFANAGEEQPIVVNTVPTGIVSPPATAAVTTNPLNAAIQQAQKDLDLVNKTAGQ